MTAKKSHAGNTKVAQLAKENGDLKTLVGQVDQDRQRLQRDLQSANDRLRNAELGLKMHNDAQMRLRKMKVVFTSGESTEVEYTFKIQRGWWHIQQANGTWLRLNPANILYMEDLRVPNALISPAKEDYSVR